LFADGTGSWKRKLVSFRGVYWIRILKDFLSKINLEDFKRFCGIILIL
jgi:hypothetical protein